MTRLRILLPSLVADGHRVLLFSQWTQILDLLEVFLTRCLNLEYLRLDGATGVADRQPIIDRFTAETDIPVMLISTRAGGLGYDQRCIPQVKPRRPHIHSLCCQ
jgi:SWI/SNF-related matrix-associated actin-dependent regulator 1 of chromatin subfamily A